MFVESPITLLGIQGAEEQEDLSDVRPELNLLSEGSGPVNSQPTI